jgi:hypothetical protein
MNSETVDMMKKELLEDDEAIRSEFLNRFPGETLEFIGEISNAYESLKRYDQTVGSDKRRAYIAAFFFNAINNLLASTKLLFSGYSIPSGNLVRQTIEAICCGILCSSANLRVYEQIDQNKFSANNAGRLVLKHCDALNVNKEQMVSLLKLHDFYHEFSHSSLLGLGQNMSLSHHSKAIYLGASFDEAKLFAYEKEVSTRVNLAILIAKAIDGLPNAEKTSVNKRVQPIAKKTGSG